jgi:predicted AlkP superfamily phosphohydrolase/phosphomutase
MDLNCREEENGILKNRTMLIGLDGATFTVLDPLMEEGVMPFLKKFTASGVRGTLPSVVPPLTPPAWTSVVTGRSPGNHGIFDFLRFESTHGPYLTHSNSRHVRCETIWSMVSRHGLKAASLNFTMMAPVRPISGYVIPGWVPWRLMRRAFYPSELYNRLKVLPGFNLKELAMDITMDEKAVEGCSQEEYMEWIQLHIRREQRWFETLCYLMREDSCHLMGIVFDGVDKIQHLCWRFLDPALFPQTPSPWEHKVRDLCLGYFRQLDQFISETVSLAGPEANVFIVSDHGFTATREIFYLNAWLHQHGYLEWANDASVNSTASRKLGLDLPNKQPYLLDWTKTTAYALTPSSNAIHICVAGQRSKEGIPPVEYEHFRQELIESLRRFTDPVTGEPVITSIRTREQIFAGNHMQDAPDLTLTLRDGGFVSILKSDVLLEPRSELLGTHHPEGTFIAWGPSIRKGLSFSQLSILDITPTLLYCLGLPIPEDLEGHVLTEILEQRLLQSHPVRMGEPTKPPEPFPKRTTEEDDKDRAEILSSLKALGYVE